MEEAARGVEIITRYFSDFTERQAGQFGLLESLYADWNNKINVISRKVIGGLYEKHVLHSLSIAAAFAFTPGLQVIDIGTGGGFPGIPLAIYFPDTQFHLVDSIAKKLKVVEAVAEALGLNNVSIAHQRAEEIRDRKFDLAISRAVAPLKNLWAWSRPLLRPRNLPRDQAADDIPSGLISLKGGDLSQEISESGARPTLIDIQEIFSEAYFHEKYIVHIPYQRFH